MPSLSTLFGNLLEVIGLKDKPYSDQYEQETQMNAQAQYIKEHLKHLAELQKNYRKIYKSPRYSEAKIKQAEQALADKQISYEQYVNAIYQDCEHRRAAITAAHLLYEEVRKRPTDRQVGPMAWKVEMEMSKLRDQLPVA